MSVLMILLGILGKIATAATVVGGVMLVGWRLLASANNAGRREKEREQLLQEIHDAELARTAAAGVSDLGDHAVLDELHHDFDRK